MTLNEREKLVKWLKRYRDLKESERDLNDELAELVESLDGVRATQITGLPKGTPERDAVDKALDKIQLIELDIAVTIAQKADARMEITKAIESVPDEKLVRVLRNRYILDRRWEEICVKMGYEWAQIHRMHNAALEWILKDDTK